MPVPRSRVAPNTASVEASSLAYGLWAPALKEAHEATEAAARHWRALLDLQISAAGEACRLASSHAERRNEALNQMMDSLWPAQSGKERSDV